MASQSQVWFHLEPLGRGGLSVDAVHLGQVPQLDHAVLRDGGHCIDTWHELDSPDDVHMRLELVLFTQLDFLAVT